MYHRYRIVADYCGKKEVLEVAYGSGQGLGYLARSASHVVGGDCTEKLVQSAREYYKDRVELYHLDAHQRPFKGKSFDTVILYEALYYLAEPETFFTRGV